MAVNVVPRASTRKALGKAGTEAAITGMQAYGPHAVGLILVAVPITLIGLAAHGVFGLPSAVTIPGTGIVIGIKAVAPALVAMVEDRKARKDR